jgi:hypothetical protein
MAAADCLPELRAIVHEGGGTGRLLLCTQTALCWWRCCSLWRWRLCRELAHGTGGGHRQANSVIFRVLAMGRRNTARADLRFASGPVSSASNIHNTTLRHASPAALVGKSAALRWGRQRSQPTRAIQPPFGSSDTPKRQVAASKFALAAQAAQPHPPASRLLKLPTIEPLR